MHPSAKLQAAVILLGAAAAPVAQAGFLAQFTGWTEMNDCFVCDTTVSFAVWENADGNWSDDLGAFGSTRLDVLGTDPDYSAGYVYLYQLVNTNYNQTGPEEPIRDFQVVNDGGSRFSSGGYLDAVFQDSSGPVGVAGNVTLADADFAGDTYDTDGDFSTPEDDSAPDAIADPPRNQTPSSDHRPNVRGVTGVGLTADTAGRRPENLRLAVDEDFNLQPPPGNPPGNISTNPVWVTVVDFNWTIDVLDSDYFEPTAYSPILFLTSDFSPVFKIGTSRSIDVAGSFPDIPDRDGNFENVWPGANGDLPVPMPVPTAEMLLLPGLWLLRRHARGAART
jgi:hypothetical protein